MGKYAWIIFIIFIVWQVVTGAAQNAAKKQQQAKMNDIARRRRAATSSGGGQSAPSSPGAPVPASRSARIDELAARRKAQIEELRKRRTAGASSGTGRGSRPSPTVQAKIGSASPSKPARMPRGTASPGNVARGAFKNAPGRVAPATPAARTREITSLKADLRPPQGAQDVDRRVREEQMRVHLQQQAAQQDRADVEDKKRAAARVRKARTKDSGAAEGYSQKDRRVHRAKTDRYARLMRSRRTLRDLFVLRELLDAPVALRPDSRL